MFDSACEIEGSASQEPVLPTLQPTVFHSLMSLNIKRERGSTPFNFLRSPRENLDMMKRHDEGSHIGLDKWKYFCCRVWTSFFPLPAQPQMSPERLHLWLLAGPPVSPTEYYGTYFWVDCGVLTTQHLQSRPVC